MSVCGLIFSIFVFLFFGKLLYQEYFGYETEYEVTTSTVVDVSETTKNTLFKTKVIYNLKSTRYVVKVELDDGEIFEFTTKGADQYNSGDVVTIRKIYKIIDEEREFVNYNILNE